MNAKDLRSDFAKGAKEFIEKHGVKHIEEYFTKELERWKDAEINVAVTGNSGVGKSSFINAIRG